MHSESEPCLHPGCGKGQSTRGLCNSHYSFASRLIRSGESSWEYLIENGYALKPKYWPKTSPLRDPSLAKNDGSTEEQ